MPFQQKKTTFNPQFNASFVSADPKIGAS